MLFPSPLRFGDTIGLIAPSSPLEKERLLQCVNTISALGYQPVLGKSATQNIHGYLAGCDETRAEDINQMFYDDDIDAIFCLRGGYGSTRIMDLLDYSLIRQNPKIFMGYSDITSFHLAFYSLCQLVTYHGPMVSSNMVDNFDYYTQSSMERTLQMPPFQVFHNPEGCYYKTVVPGIAKGRIIGGCLSLVSPCIGTIYEPNFTNTILFLEDIDESIPRCDKLLHHLKNANVFSQVNGVLLGNFKNCTNPNDPSYTMFDFIMDFFSGYDKPVLWGIQSGHEKPMGTIPFGMVCTMNTYTNRVVFERHGM